MQYLALIVSDPWVFWSVVTFVGSFAIWAIFWPQRFAQIAQVSSSWVDSTKLLAVLDRRIEIDQFVLRYTRAFGVALLSGLALYVGLVLCR